MFSNNYNGSEAIDGIYNGGSGSMAHTLREISPWLQINLVNPAAVRGVKIWNRVSEIIPGN